VDERKHHTLVYVSAGYSTFLWDTLWWLKGFIDENGSG